MTHVATNLLDLHKGTPNTLDIGQILDADGIEIDFETGSAVAPTLTLVRLDGTEVEEVIGAPILVWPLDLVPTVVDAEEHWIATMTTLDVEHGERLRGIVEFTDPEGNPIELIYRVRVVPAIGS